MPGLLRAFAELAPPGPRRRLEVGTERMPPAWIADRVDRRPRAARDPGGPSQRQQLTLAALDLATELALGRRFRSP